MYIRIIKLYFFSSILTLHTSLPFMPLGILKLVSYTKEYPFIKYISNACNNLIKTVAKITIFFFFFQSVEF